ncbi:cob(I)yrinic acid a,c-diamide adenosyltransferase [Varunaivibrio sulfuroxidans]|uniref:Corrinoid adenosyltransferase n=1 Tax=Varunaivibrio sulfuroxidans TaxID=1773489 RepID=A0A4R3JGT9_9PROT|nr:cob(I)yrinic acid a,c-diamide adenosyltransferase [Varunaivibrio sulfuroxidans]TCS65147.1 cob(I)yrinic acid a,c-diamide adenosyltransferase [Varunaivibrio sulfuroxidans]WES29569.1 cob(I)yrinic acid a,c-diamide adenosyltransferase [Varunaivibrio sulfuroxidans]
MREDDIEENRRHQAKMAKKKGAREKIMAEKNIRKGLLIVHTGKGKGKSTAAWGMALRCIGHGKKVGIVQFIKGAWETGERVVFDKFPDLCVIEALGEGFSWETQDRERDIKAAERAWEAAMDMLRDPSYAMVIMDELNIVLRYGNLPLEKILEGLGGRPAMQHAVVTGRNAPVALIESADLVTEMTLVKHPFRGGVEAQPGVEF